MSPEGEGQFSGKGQGCEPLAPRITVSGHVKGIWVGEPLAQKQGGSCAQKYSYQGLLLTLIRNMFNVN